MALTSLGMYHCLWRYVRTVKGVDVKFKAIEIPNFSFVYPTFEIPEFTLGFVIPNGIEDRLFLNLDASFPTNEKQIQKTLLMNLAVFTRGKDFLSTQRFDFVLQKELVFGHQSVGSFTLETEWENNHQIEVHAYYAVLKPEQLISPNPAWTTRHHRSLPLARQMNDLFQQLPPPDFAISTYPEDSEPEKYTLKCHKSILGSKSKFFEEYFNQHPESDTFSMTECLYTTLAVQQFLAMDYDDNYLSWFIQHERGEGTTMATALYNLAMQFDMPCILQRLRFSIVKGLYNGIGIHWNAAIRCLATALESKDELLIPYTAVACASSELPRPAHVIAGCGCGGCRLLIAGGVPGEVSKHSVPVKMIRVPGNFNEFYLKYETVVCKP